MAPPIINFTTQTLSVLNCSVKTSQYLGSSPYILNPTTRSFTINNSKRYKLQISVGRISHLFLMIEGIFVTFVGYRRSANPALLITIVLAEILSIVDQVIDFVNWKYGEDFVALMNGSRIYLDLIHRKLEISRTNHVLILTFLQQGNILKGTKRKKEE